MPNPFFGLALGLCTQANSHQERWGQAPISSTLRDYIARAHAVVVLDKNQKRTNAENVSLVELLSFERRNDSGKIILNPKLLLR